jgi:hypothetical protein
MLKRTIFLAAVRATLALLVGTAIAPGFLTGSLTGSLCLAQSTTSARLSGSVTDQSGAVVPNAQVIALNVDTSLSLTAKSDSAGNYAFNSIPVGNYKVTATATGFEILVETDVKLTVGQSATLNLPLKAGGSSETVTVEGGAELINTTTADLGQTVDEATIHDLPLNGRDPGTLVTLSAGVTNELNSNASTLQTTNSFPNETGASAGGQRQGSTWYLLDGVSHMDTYLLLAFPSPIPTRPRSSASSRTTSTRATASLQRRSSVSRPSPAPTNSMAASLSSSATDLSTQRTTSADRTALQSL